MRVNMPRLTVFALSLLIFLGWLWGSSYSDFELITPIKLPSGTTPPVAWCDEASEEGRMYWDTDAPSGKRHYGCEGVGGWKLQGDGTSVGGGSPCDAFPVGSIFISTVSTNPGTSLGCGTWSAFGAGRVLVGLDSGDTDFDTSEETGGAKTVASTGSNAAESTHTHSVTSNVTVTDHASHTHTYTEVPNHVHIYTSQTNANGSATSYEHGTLDTSSAEAEATETTNNPTGGVATGTTAGPSATLTHTPTNNAVTSGAGSSHNHNFTGNATSVVQPYITCFFWKRVS